MHGTVEEIKTAGKKCNSTICVLTNWIRPIYKYEIISGIEEEASKNNVNVIYYLAHELKEVVLFEKYQEVIFTLFDKKCINYLIFMSGLLDIIPAPISKNFLQRASSIPILTISFQTEKYPAIMVDNKQGLKNMIRHFINDHNKTKIAFIKGNAFNYDAIERFNAYKEVLAEYKIPLRPELVYDSNFTQLGGMDAVRVFIEERRLQPGRDFEVIIASNDDMAIGAGAELTRRNIKIPEDAAIGGFDDIESAQYLDIPLTTVRLPNKALGREAVKYILNSTGEKQITLVPTQMIIRNSCGCHRNEIIKPEAGITSGLEVGGKNKNQQPVQVDNPATQDYLIRSIQKFLVEILETETASRLAAQFVDAFICLWKDRQSKSFFKALYRIFNECIKDNNYLNYWNTVLTFLINWLLQTQHTSLQSRQVVNILEESFHEISNFIIKKTIKDSLSLDRYMEKLRNAGGRIKITQELEHFFNIIKESLFHLDFHSFYLFRYQEAGINNTHFMIILGVSDNQNLPINPEQSYYKNFCDIYKKLLLRDHTVAYCIFPLFINNQLFGFIITNKTQYRYERLVYDELTSQISNALKGSQLLIETKQASLELEKTNLDLKNIEAELQYELSAAVKLQTCLIPQEIKIPGLDIAGKMIISQSSGGDYYDVIRTAEKDWIVMGDAAGQGIYASLGMLMVQTSIQIILKKQPGIDPRQLIALVIENVVRNMKRLGNKDFMQLAVLTHHNGLFTCSGYHPPFLIYRNAEEKVEYLETKDEPAAFTLAEDDSLLLYTDGIIKARYKNTPGKYYNIEQFAAVFKKKKKAGAKEILDAIIAGLANYSCQDDISVLIIRNCDKKKNTGGQV